MCSYRVHSVFNIQHSCFHFPFPVCGPWLAAIYLMSSKRWLLPCLSRASPTQRSMSSQESAYNPSSGCETHIAALARFHTSLLPLVGHATSHQCIHNFSATLSNGSLTLLLRSCKLSFIRFVGWRHLCRQLLAHSSGKATLWKRCIFFSAWLL